MSAEMHSFDKLPYGLRRAIDESPYGSSAFLCICMIQRGRVTADEAERRIRGWKRWEDARDWNALGQRVAFGSPIREFR